MDNRAVQYERKSTDEKDRQVQSLEDQRAENTQTLERNNLELIAPPFKEERSARKPNNRPEFSKMLKLLKQGKAKSIVCWSANRLARNSIDGGELLYLVQNQGVKIYTPYTVYDSTNWFMLMFEFGMATDYSLKLSKDVKRGLDSKVSKKWRPGLAPIGYLNKGDVKGEKWIEADPQRFSICKEWWKLMLTGKYTVLESLEVISNPPYNLRRINGDKFSRTQAFKFFHNIFYTGNFMYLGELREGAHPKMVTLRQFDRVQQIITGKYSGRYEQPTAPREPLPLAGFIKCGECGSTVSSDKKIKQNLKGDVHEYAWYKCKKNKGKCSQSYMKSSLLDDEVNKYIGELELDEDFINWVRGVLKRRNKDELTFDQKNRELYSKQLEDVRKKKFDLREMKIDGLFDESDYKKEVLKLVKEENLIKEALSSDRSDYWEQVIDKTLDFATHMREMFNSPYPDIKKLVLQILGADLILKDKKLTIEAKGAFVFLRSEQDKIFEELARGGLNSEAKNDLTISKLPSGAGEGTRTPDVLLGKQTFYH